MFNQEVLRTNPINQSPVGQREADSQGLANFVSARPPTGDYYSRQTSNVS